jgi:hypothetical protein
MLFTMIRLYRRRGRAQAAFWEAEHFAGRFQQMLAETSDAESRAWMLAEAARHERVMGANRDAAFGRWSRCTTALEYRYAYQLLSMLADVEAHVAAEEPWEIDPNSDAADDMRVLGVATSVLARMAATADLDERMDLLRDLYDAVYPLVGGQAAEVLATLPAPGWYGWDRFPPVPRDASHCASHPPRPTRVTCGNPVPWDAWDALRGTPREGEGNGS